MNNKNYQKKDASINFQQFKNVWIERTKKDPALSQFGENIFNEDWFVSLAYLENNEQLKDSLTTNIYSAIMKQFKACNICGNTIVVTYQCGHQFCKKCENDKEILDKIGAKVPNAHYKVNYFRCLVCNEIQLDSIKDYLNYRANKEKSNSYNYVQSSSELMIESQINEEHNLVSKMKVLYKLFREKRIDFSKKIDLKKDLHLKKDIFGVNHTILTKLNEPKKNKKSEKVEKENLVSVNFFVTLPGDKEFSNWFREMLGVNSILNITEYHGIHIPQHSLWNSTNTYDNKTSKETLSTSRKNVTSSLKLSKEVNLLFINAEKLDLDSLILNRMPPSFWQIMLGYLEEKELKNLSLCNKNIRFLVAQNGKGNFCWKLKILSKHFVVFPKYEKTMSSLLWNRNSKLKYFQLIKYMLDIAKYVSQLHKIGVSSFNILPENVFINKTDNAVLNIFSNKKAYKPFIQFIYRTNGKHLFDPTTNIKNFGHLLHLLFIRFFTPTGKHFERFFFVFLFI